MPHEMVGMTIIPTIAITRTELRLRREIAKTLSDNKGRSGRIEKLNQGT
jgi:hypothetical protein